LRSWLFARRGDHRDAVGGMVAANCNNCAVRDAIFWLIADGSPRFRRRIKKAAPQQIAPNQEPLPWNEPKRTH
jgi:hypothetical protein